MRCLHLALALSLILAVPGLAQPAAPTRDATLHWSFDVDTGGWQSTDPQATLSVTQEAAVCRPNGGGALQFAYTPGAAQFTAVMVPTEGGVGNGKSLHFWIRTSEYAMMMVLAGEGDESRYSANFTSLPNRWQEVSLALDRMQSTDDSKDKTVPLDPAKITGLALCDATGMMVKAAQQVPFLVAPDLGPRKLWLDDFSVTSSPAQPRWTETTIGGKPAVLLDSFERAPLEWLMLAGKGIEVDYDGEHKASGKYSLRVQYALPAGKIFGTITPLAGVPLKGARSLSLAIMSETAITLFVELKETNNAKYQTTVPLEAGEPFRTPNVPFDQFKLANDSPPDPDGRLDADQLKEMTLADLSAAAGNAAPANTLWLDDVAFLK